MPAFHMRLTTLILVGDSDLLVSRPPAVPINVLA